MCYFVFVGVPARQREPAERAFAAIGCDVLDVGNLSVRGQFPPGVAVVAILHRGCSCDLAATRSATFDEHAERRRYRKKGWSERKIDAAVRARKPAERPIFAAFRGAVVELARSGGPVHLLTHVFGGDLQVEAVPACPSVSMTVQTYLDGAGAYEPDTRVVVHAEGQGAPTSSGPGLT